jgi:hypothetical protein
MPGGRARCPPPARRGRVMLHGMATAPKTTLLILGADRVDLTPAKWKARAKDSFSAAQPPAKVTCAIAKHTAYVKTDLLDEGQPVAGPAGRRRRPRQTRARTE